MARKTKLIAVYWFLLLLACCTQAQTGIAQQAKIPGNFCISEAEWKLYRMINEYRRQYDLPPIPLSSSLSYVANTHVKDLFFHHPDRGDCNFHSWSDRGPWKPFCYPGDEDKKNSVWDKPKELSGYPAKGFEIVYWENNALVIDSVIAFWRSLDYFNSFLMNTGRWQGRQWNAIGIGICQNYAAAWFGEAPDPGGSPYICGEQPRESKPDSAPPSSLPALSDNPTPNREDTQGAAIHTSDQYYIIVKSQIPAREAERMVQHLQGKGYPLAKVLPSGNHLRVSIFETANREEALRYLKEAKGIYPDAWLLKR